MTASIETTEFVIRTIAQTAVDNEKYFGDLDAVVGDGDFGYSLARGFEQVLAKWSEFDRTDAGTLVLRVATTITSRIGGTSGPIWGTAFLRVGTTIKGGESVTPTDVVAGLRAAIEGIKKRGNSDVGDKTLLDALVPATDAFEAAIAAGDDPAGALRSMAVAARAAAEATTGMQARRGRASYTGERSIGSPDAGAVALAVIAEKLADEWPARTGGTTAGASIPSAADPITQHDDVERTR
ncbi:dihydroxyacetone kinase subunit DhaL [Marisediminicola senii]|uniref:dihydroxyacetone kinase subunit DhaL n=1 Tax=Marisediminicola senii TaxID=2711233 RepID=UPI0013ED0CF5|nr:dihydroxyacetone kinase subunit DhaL [Marisediminicola senii]